MPKLEETVVELRIGQARHEEQLKSIDEKMDELGVDVKDIKKSLSDDVKTSNKWMRSVVLKLIAMLVAGGIGGGAVQAIQAMTPPPAPITQPLDQNNGN